MDSHAPTNYDASALRAALPSKSITSYPFCKGSYSLKFIVIESKEKTVYAGDMNNN